VKDEPEGHRWYVFYRDSHQRLPNQPPDGFGIAQQAGKWMQDHSLQLTTYTKLAPPDSAGKEVNDADPR
jgi:hypothetical protein